MFFANNQEFKQGAKEEQEIAMNCRMLIQNAIVLWNYLYLSQRLANAPENQQAEWLGMIKKGSTMLWRHINFNGEYDFRAKVSSSNEMFDMEKILGWDVAAFQ